MLVKVHLPSYERIIGAKRTLEALLSDYRQEMSLFLAMTKGAIIFRITNDNESEQVVETSIMVSRLMIGVREYEISIRTMKKVYETGHGFRRKSKLVDWKPLAKRTIEERNLMGFPYPLYPRLYRTGALLKDLVQGGFGHYERITKRSFIMGTTNKVAIAHELGTKNIPAREFYYISDDLYFFFKKILSLKINTAFRTLRSLGKYVR